MGAPSDGDSGAKNIGADETVNMDAQATPLEPAATALHDLGGEQYTVEKLLGHGGMGEVYKAYDRVIGRHLALKLLYARGTTSAESLIHEARAQARVEHPNVCKVYGVGELGGRPFIALQFIDGETLRTLAKQMTREEIVRAVRDVAEGLHAAHRLGLVHRDVKPANILVERTPDGYHPYVTDFGLAKDVDATALTHTGVSKGTPAYMAPEQARGDSQHIDRRTDVYALGVVLYELLTGRLPFDGDGAVAVMLAVINQEPKPPRALNPAIPDDLAIITLKCMEKDPARRYDSARAVAADLEAWLDGAPIVARGASIGYRLLKRARRHRVALSLLALVLTVAAVFAGYAVRARRLAAEQAELAQSFGQEVERNDAIARYAALLPIHDTRRERRFIEDSLAALQRQMTALGRVAEAPGRYALGRGFLTLKRAADARRELEAAWRLGNRAPEVAYALGLAYGELYRVALAELASDDPARRAFARTDAERRWRDPALEHLKNARTATSLAPDYIEGLIALYERRWPDALTKSRQAGERVPWLFEAATLEGDVHADAAKVAWERAGAVEALGELTLADEAYARALNTARSSPEASRGRCEADVLRADILGSTDKPPFAAVADALAACDQALQVRPDDAWLVAEEAVAWIARAQYEEGHNGPARTSWQRAEELATRAATLRDDDVAVLVAATRVHRLFARFLIEHGENPLPLLDAALAGANRALSIDPHSQLAAVVVPGVWQLRGDWEGASGIDPRPSWATGIGAAERARAQAPDDWFARLSLGGLYLSRGMWAANNSIDIKPDLEAAAAQFDAILREHPSESMAAQNLCVAVASLAQNESHAALVPPAFARARQACGRAFELRPSAANAANAAMIGLAAGDWAFDHGASPLPELAGARALVTKALAIDHDNPLAFYAKGGIAVLTARWEMREGRSPLAAFAEADAAFSSALKANPHDADVLCGLVAVHRHRAAWHAAHNQSAAADIAAGLRRVSEAEAINPKLGIVALHAGVLHLMTARASSGHDRAAAATRARIALERAIALDREVTAEATPLLAESIRLAQ